MKQNYCLMGFVDLDENESGNVIGGIDKAAQDALYMIGYALGSFCRALVTLKSKIFKQVSNALD